MTFKLKRLALLNGEPLSLRTLHAILGTSLLTVFNAGAVKRMDQTELFEQCQRYYANILTPFSRLVTPKTF